MTGAYVYWFLDPEKVGEQNVAANALSFAALSNTCKSAPSSLRIICLIC